MHSSHRAVINETLAEAKELEATWPSPTKLETAEKELASIEDDAKEAPKLRERSPASKRRNDVKQSQLDELEP